MRTRPRTSRGHTRVTASGCAVDALPAGVAALIARHRCRIEDDEAIAGDDRIGGSGARWLKSGCTSRDTIAGRSARASSGRVTADRPTRRAPR